MSNRYKRPNFFFFHQIVHTIDADSVDFPLYRRSLDVRRDYTPHFGR